MGLMSTILKFVNFSRGRYKEGYGWCILGMQTNSNIEVFNRLKGVGFDINESDFVIVDQSDERAKYISHEARRAVEQLSSGTSLRHIQEIRDRVMHIVESLNGDGDILAMIDIPEILEGWLDTDLSDQSNEIQGLVAECVQENTEEQENERIHYNDAVS
mmetsp:Transcript_24729/g.53339  ORF Transcript_24729/g.53339 Transcript_24729/m.53339 type:complete len:159 (+) Transcript_24729:532-1008(+)